MVICSQTPLHTCTHTGFRNVTSLRTHRCIDYLWLCVWLQLSPLRWHEGEEVYFHCSGKFVCGIVRRLRSACCRLYLPDHPSVNATPPPVGGQIAPLLHHHPFLFLFLFFFPVEPSHCGLYSCARHSQCRSTRCPT